MNKKLMSVLFVSIMVLSMAMMVEAKPFEEEIILKMDYGYCFNDDGVTRNIKTILIESFKNDNYVSLQTKESISGLNDSNGIIIEDWSPIKMFIKPSIKGKSNTGYREWDNYYYGSYYMRHYNYEEWTTPVNIRIGKTKYIGELTTTQTNSFYYYQDGYIHTWSSTGSHLSFKNLEETCYLSGSLLWQ